MPNALEIGSTGPEVTELQQKLVEMGYFVGNVDGEPDSFLELLRGFLRPVQIGNHDSRSFGREPLGDRIADSLRATGDDRDPAFQ